MKGGKQNESKTAVVQGIFEMMKIIAKGAAGSQNRDKSRMAAEKKGCGACGDKK